MSGNIIDKNKLTPVDINGREKLDFNSGDTVRVWSKIVDEKGKTRLQAFEGIVLARKHNKEIGATFTVRKVASGVGVERIFPLFSPTIDKIELTKKARARKSKIYYLREKATREIRRKLRSVMSMAGISTADFEEDVVEEEVAAPDTPEKVTEAKAEAPEKVEEAKEEEKKDEPEEKEAKE